MESVMIVRTEDIVHRELWRLFPAINVDKVKDTPKDYPGPMGVPITFMDKYNPERFEILGLTRGNTSLENGRIPYRRIVVRNLMPELPDEVDLAYLLERCGVEIEVELMTEGEVWSS